MKKKSWFLAGILICIILFMILMMLVILGGGIASNDILPIMEEEYLVEYREIAALTHLNWADMVALDTVRYEKDFANVNISDTAFDFLIIEYDRKEEREYCSGRDENGECMGTYTEWVVVEQKAISGKKDILRYLNSIGHNTISWTIREVVEAYNALDMTDEYDVRFSSKDIDELTGDFTEQQKEWINILVYENIIFEVLGEVYELPTHIPVIGNSEFAWPAPTLNKITSAFGWRIDPVYGTRDFHYGIDISGAGAMGQPVISTAAGVVSQVNYNNSISGMNIRIKHIDDDGNEWVSRYSHLSQINVKVGQEVSQGAVIGAVGSTGKSTGPHLHFELKFLDRHVDPYPYIF